MRTWAGALALCGLLGVSAPAAGMFEVTPYYGYRLGGEIDDFSTGAYSNLEVKDGDALGLILTFNVNPNGQVELIYSRQSSRLTGSGFLSPTPPGADLFDLDVETWHVGGTYTGGQAGDPARGFVGASLGVTNFEPEGAGYEGDAQFSFGLYGGVKVALGRHFGLRLQGQWVATHIGSQEEVFCDPFGSCWVVDDPSYMNQFELGAGITFKF